MPFITEELKLFSFNDDRFLIQHNYPTEIEIPDESRSNYINWLTNIKNKLETFSDKHFKNALNDFNQEVKKLKNHIPDDFLKIEQISHEIKQSYNKFLEQNFFDYESLNILKNKLKSNIDNIHKIYS